MTRTRAAHDGPKIGAPEFGTKGIVGYLTSEYPATSHTFIRREVAQLRNQGLDVRTYSIRPPSGPLTDPQDKSAAQETYYVLGQGVVRHLTSNFIAFFRSPGRYLSTLGKAFSHRVPGLKAFIWALFHFVESMTLARQLQRDGISHLHNHFANSAATVGMMSAHYARIPWSLTLHGISETDYPAGLLLARKVEAASFVACVSWFGRAQAMRITAVEQWTKFHTVRCGIPLDRLPDKDAAQDGQPVRKIVSVARLSAEKGLPGMLQAVSVLRAQGVDVELTIVGDGPERAKLEEQIGRLGIGNAVSLVGRLPESETLEMIASADLFVLPSFMEGLPVVLMEAMALRVPVVASRIAGVPELVREGETGLLFDPANWDDLADMMRKSLNNRSNAQEMASRARSLIEQEFDIVIATAELPRLFADPATVQEKQRKTGHSNAGEGT